MVFCIISEFLGFEKNFWAEKDLQNSNNHLGPRGTRSSHSHLSWWWVSPPNDVCRTLQVFELRKKCFRWRMFADLDWFFRVSWTDITWKFFSLTKKIAKYVRNHHEVLLTLQGRGRRWSGASWSSEIHSGFMNMFRIKIFFPKLKTSDRTQKPYVGPFHPQKGQGWCYRLHPDLDWFFPVSRIHSRWKFSSETQKFAN